MLELISRRRLVRKLMDSTDDIIGRKQVELMKAGTRQYLPECWRWCIGSTIVIWIPCWQKISRRPQRQRMSSQTYDHDQIDRPPAAIVYLDQTGWLPPIIPVFRRLGVSQLAVDTSLTEPRRLRYVDLGNGISGIRAGGRFHSSDPVACGAICSLQMTS